MLVTGGRDEQYNYLSSTEIFTLDTENWISAASLPSPRLDLRGGTLGNSVFVFGKIYIQTHFTFTLKTYFTGGQFNYDTYYDDILEYEQTTDTWRPAGKMKTPRTEHSVGPVDDISQLCPPSSN